MAGRLAGHQDVLGAHRARREPGRGGTHPHPEGRTQAILAQPPSQTGVRAGFWDVPAIREVVKILPDDRYQADSSYRLLLRLCGPSLEPPGPVRRTPRRESHHQTHGRGDDPSQELVGSVLEVYTAGEVRLEHEAWTRRMQPPKGQRTRPSVDRQKTSQSFPGALSPTSRTVTPYPTEQNRNTWQTTLAPDLLQRETEAGKIVVVPDNARSHHAKMLAGLYEPGRLLERITPIHPPPYAPDHNPVEHVRNTAKNNTATIQRETPEETFETFASHVTGRTVDYDFEHLPLRETRNDFVSRRPEVHSKLIFERIYRYHLPSLTDDESTYTIYHF